MGFGIYSSEPKGTKSIHLGLEQLVWYSNISLDKWKFLAWIYLISEVFAIQSLGIFWILEFVDNPKLIFQG